MTSVLGFIFAFLVALVAILPTYHLIYNSNTPVCLWGHCFSFPQSTCTGRQNTHQDDGLKPASPFGLGSPPIVFSPQVWAALESGQPVVALESTIITHGMPYPANVETAIAVEASVARGGAVAATVAVLNGRVHVGLTRGQLHALGKLALKAVKCSRRDISALVAHAPLSSLSVSSSVSTDADSEEPVLGPGTGATTVAATSYLARLAHPDLRVFVTGGIGGVHRGWESSLDVSADLTELGRTDITVVCAGAKSILDIPATLEYLETQGVTVVGYQTDYFPSFFTSKSGVKVPYRADSTSEIARMINANRIMRVQSGMVVGVPISAADELNSQHIESSIKEALAEAKEKNMSGKDITPFLLEKVNNLTKGDSLKANIQLILQNARVGAQIAKDLSTLLSSLRTPLTTESIPSTVPTTESVGHVAVFGGAVVDLVATPFNPLVMGASNPGKLYQGMGGVARNIAEGLARLLSTTRPQTRVQFISALGYDAHGDILLNHSNKLNISMQHSLRVKEQSTAVYSATLDHAGELVVAMADMDVFNSVSPHYILQNHILALISKASVVVVDGNFQVDTIRTICNSAHQNGVPIWFEPTSIPKCIKIIQADALSLLTYISPNRGELLTMLKMLTQVDVVGNINISTIAEDDINGHITLVNLFQKLSKVEAVIMKMGGQGVIVAAEGRTIHYPAIPVRPIVSVTGAGDSLAAGTLWGLMAQHPTTSAKVNFKQTTLHTAIKFGLAAAKMSLESSAAINTQLQATTLREMVDLTN